MMYKVSMSYFDIIYRGSGRVHSLKNRPPSQVNLDNWGRVRCIIVSGITRALMGGGGVYSYICVLPELISFEMNLKTTDFKRNSSGRTRI